MDTYVDIKKGKQPKRIALLTNDFDMRTETIVAIYRSRWQIESLFTQIKQNLPLRYFYGESANAIKIQICVTLIANLRLSVLQSSLTRPWSFSGLATMVRIVMMDYINLESFFNQPDADLKNHARRGLGIPASGGRKSMTGVCPKMNLSQLAYINKLGVTYYGLADSNKVINGGPMEIERAS